jgi:hypothetical protein
MASEKKPFVIRIQPELLKALEKWASDEFRSVNGQIEYLLHKALTETKRLKENSTRQEGEENKPMD